MLLKWHKKSNRICQEVWAYTCAWQCLSVDTADEVISCNTQIKRKCSRSSPRTQQHWHLSIKWKSLRMNWRGSSRSTEKHSHCRGAKAKEFCKSAATRSDGLANLSFSKWVSCFQALTHARRAKCACYPPYCQFPHFPAGHVIGMSTQQSSVRFDEGFDLMNERQLRANRERKDKHCSSSTQRLHKKHAPRDLDHERESR